MSSEHCYLLASVWCNVVQCVAVCCSVLRYVAVCKHTFFDNAVRTVLLDTPRVQSPPPPTSSDEARTVDSWSCCVECANSLKSASKSSTSASNTNCSQRMYESWHIYIRHGACCSAQNTGMSYGTYESDLRSVAVCCSVLQCVLHCSKHMHELWLPLGMYDGTYEWVMGHMSESWDIWVSHGTYEWVMAHMSESWHIWVSHCTYEWVMAHMSESLHIWVSHCTYEWVISHMSESCHRWVSHVTYERVMSNMNQSCHIWMSLVTY